MGFLRGLINLFFKVNFAALLWNSLLSPYTENYGSVASWDVYGLIMIFMYGVTDVA